MLCTRLQLQRVIHGRGSAFQAMAANMRHSFDNLSSIVKKTFQATARAAEDKRGRDFTVLIRF
jgi:hypothetical protein